MALVVDTSAILALAFAEHERDRFLEALAYAPHVFVSAVTFFECSIVLLGRTGISHPQILKDIFLEFAIEIVPVEAVSAHRAVEAYRRYGKGIHPAGLNFGDCFSYALAMQRGEPLLFKGDDFSKTDVQIA